MTFTPPVTAAPTGLNFTGLGPSTMTLNWTDSSNELSYAIYRSADGVSYTQVGTAVQNATSFNASGLAVTTNYFWQVVAIGEGNVSAPLSGSQATVPPGNVASTGVGGNWSNPLTWTGGVVPTSGDNVTISAGATVIIDVAAVAYTVNVANTATLRWDAAVARTLTVDGSVTNNGTFDTPATGTVTTHVLSVGADLTNNGTLDFSTNANTAGAGITFTGASNNTFGGSGTTTDVRTLTVNKGTASTNVLELNPATFTVQGVATDVAGFVTLTNGMLKLSGSFPLTNRMFTTAAYSIGATAGFWLNNPNATVAAQNGSPTVTGRLRISQGIYNIGTATGNSMGFSTGANITVDGGTVNAASRFGVSAAANAISYTQSSGTITVNTAGNTSTTLASYDLGTSTSSTIAISGGTVIVQLANTAASGPRDYRDQAGTGSPSVTGGTVQFGNAASGAAKAFSAAGIFPNTIVNTTSGNHSLTLLAPAGYNNLMGNLTIGTGGSFSTGNNVFLFNGDTITNNGTIASTGTSARFIVFRPATNVVYQGSGIVTAPMNSLELQNDLNFTFDPAVSNIVAGRVIIFGGNFVNANKLTLGNNALAIVQIGNTTTPTNGGTFDVAPNFNLGTGGQTISYLRTVNAKTTGPEVNPTRTLVSMTYDDDDLSHVLTLAGGDLTVNTTATTALTLANGRIVTGASKLSLGGTGTVTRTAGYVDGTFAKTFTAAASKTLEIGTANGYSPVVANVTAGTFPLAVEGSAVQSAMPNFAPASKAITRHWRIAAPAGTTADLTFNYLDADVPVTATEANLRLYNGVPNPPTSFTDLGGSPDTGANLLAMTGISQFGYFSLAEAGGGTAADLSITKTDGVTQAETGQNLTYTVTVNNPGSVAVNGATVSDTPDANLTCGNWTCAAAGGASCGAASGTGNLADTPSLPVAGSVTYTHLCTVATVSAAATVGNTATVALPAGFVDATPGNNSATDTDTLTRLVNASITKTDGSSTTSPGAAITYTIVAGNSGPNTATTTVSDTFTGALTGCTWTCAAASGSCGAPSGSGNLADVGSIQAGGNLTYTASCTVSPSASGTLTNIATVAVGGSERDTNTANNTATDVDTILALPDVAVSMTDNRQFVRVGESLSYAITVANPGGITATAVVNDPLPAVLGSGSWTCVPTGGASCAPGTGNTLNDTATLPAGSQVSYVYSATVLTSSADDRIVNTVTATVSGDPNTANNTVTDTDVIVLFKNGFESAPVTVMPQGSDGYTAGRLRVDPQLLAGLGLNPVAVASGIDANGAELFTLELARFNGQVVLRSVLRDANDLAERSAWFAIDPTQTAIEFAWQSAGADAANGYLRLAAGSAFQVSGDRRETARLSNLRVEQQQGVAWVSLIGSSN
ncbi:MAG TPA: hypothetical protein VN153_08955 [Tahibacter sp.]|nr:hypothetical protein [Tahibacter sp.]